MISMRDQKLMRKAADKARETMTSGIGGPFGAVITGPDGSVLSVASNTVLRDKDATCHAEMNAIREASSKLGTHDLSGCTIYATGAPCPMCLSAIMWANIKQLHVSGLAIDADEIGFRDDFMYDLLGDVGTRYNAFDKVDFHDRKIAQDLYKEYQGSGKEMY